MGSNPVKTDTVQDWNLLPDSQSSFKLILEWELHVFMKFSKIHPAL
jgi:hypothetical protein